MSDKKFDIVFKGEIVPGADAQAVKANVGKLFKANEKVLARLFSGEPIAIKKGVDKAATMKYRALMKKAGAVCYAQTHGTPLDASSTAAKPAPTPAKPVPPVSQQTKVPSAKVPEASSSGVSVQTESGDDWSLAPPGTILVEASEIEAIEIPDISNMTMAEVGADVIENPEVVTFDELPDVAGIDLAPVGSDVADPVERDDPAPPDVSSIDLAPVGADVADPVERNEPEPPDVSSIDLAPVGSDVKDPEPETPEPKVDISHISLE